MESSTKLNFIKIIHTLIWCLFVFVICYVLWSGITGNVSVYSWWAVAAVIGEGLVLLVFNGRCPLTVMARKYSASTRDNFDIFLPNWLAKYNKQIFIPLFCIGLAFMIFRHFE